MDAIEKDLLLKIADLHGVPEGAYNIRGNGELQGRNTTANIDIVTKTDGKSGIDIFIKPGNQSIFDKQGNRDFQKEIGQQIGLQVIDQWCVDGIHQEKQSVNLSVLQTGGQGQEIKTRKGQ